MQTGSRRSIFGRNPGILAAKERRERIENLHFAGLTPWPYRRIWRKLTAISQRCAVGTHHGLNAPSSGEPNNNKEKRP